SVIDNLVMVTGNAPFTPKVTYIANPSPQRIVLDITGVNFSDQLPTPVLGHEGFIVVDHPMIQQIRYSLFNPVLHTIRIVIDLKAKSDFKVIMDGTANIFALEITEYKLKVVIDAGHGDGDPGAISITKRKEKDFNLAVALKVKALLDQVEPIEASMTRSDDTFVTLDGRVEFANKWGADAFISIHGNYFTKTTAGTESFYWNENSKSFAEVMHTNLLLATGFPDRKLQKNDFRVVKATKMPAVLLEVGFLSHAKEEILMYTPEFQDIVAQSIVKGIKQYFNLT
ncbi:MAG: N-acetylmuramoyl-L-alanine amidase, partial [Gorillibacterium sp.]|nr:N-acetylmuramoyl-L-alanine amidase [Gorillibacterium sp.]